ncbi:wax ester synthase/diacylglycerol acyltransferase 2-like isoform X2 [Wolffia australiana]
MVRVRWGGGSTDDALYNAPVSPSSRIFLRPELELSIDCFVSFEQQIDVAAVKEALTSLANRCSRLRSVVKEDRGILRWKELPKLDIDSLIITVPDEDKKQGRRGDQDDDNAYINRYLETLPSMAPLTRNLPLWEVHVLPRQRRSLVLRFHHSLGDCVSLLALLLSSCDALSEDIPIFSDRGNKEQRSFAVRVVKRAASAWRSCKKAGDTLAFALEQNRLVARRNEDLRFVTQTSGLEDRRRKLASLVLRLDDMRVVKNKLNAKINDVLVGAVSYGLSKYLESKPSYAASGDAKITGKIVVNVRGEGPEDILRSIRQGKKIEWGNKIGYFTLPIVVEKNVNDPLDYVRKAKDLIDKRKTSSEDQYSHGANELVTKTFGMELFKVKNFWNRGAGIVLLQNSPQHQPHHF